MAKMMPRRHKSDQRLQWLSGLSSFLFWVTGNLYLQGSAPSSGSLSTSTTTTSVVGTAPDVIDLTRGFSSSQVCPWLFSKTGLFIIKILFRVRLLVLVSELIKTSSIWPEAPVALRWVLAGILFRNPDCSIQGSVDLTQDINQDIVDLTQSPPQSSSNSRDPQSSVCPVCLDSLAEIKENGSFLASTTCGHVFCGPCLTSAIRSNGRCPTCRKKVNGKQWHKLFI